MDKTSPISKLNKLIPGSVLDSRRFGRSVMTSIWVEAQTLQKVAEALKTDSEFQMDWLENLAVVELEGALVVSYFLRSTTRKHQYVLRASVVPGSAQAEVMFPSIQEIWPMGALLEREAGEMFGIQFNLMNQKIISKEINCLPENWSGFPLRKNYEFPKEFLGITHSRPFNRSPSKKTSP